ncbi:MAG: GNAT family N-acetyltransferase [Pseudomonadota bacterium]
MIQAERLAALHASSFAGPSRWSADAFAEALVDPRCFFVREEAEEDGFALGRQVVDEAELLTLIVASAKREAGLGRRLLAAFEREARKRGAAFAFLEVSADNLIARRLYDAAGWTIAGHRSGYYAGIDAVTMRKVL